MLRVKRSHAALSCHDGGKGEGLCRGSRRQGGFMCGGREGALRGIRGSIVAHMGVCPGVQKGCSEGYYCSIVDRYLYTGSFWMDLV